MTGADTWLFAFLVGALVLAFMCKSNRRSTRDWRFTVHQWKGAKLDKDWLAKHVIQTTAIAGKEK